MYEAVTHDIRIRVKPEYLEDQSSPEDDQYFWAYTIEIANQGKAKVQLKTRHWIITDANGKREEVRGPGVVGKTPVLGAGESFTYTSGCPLATPSGIMAGSYQMQLENGDLVNVEIPAFFLDSPFVVRN